MQKPAGMSWAQWARAKGYHPTTAAKRQVIPEGEGSKYRYGAVSDGSENPGPKSESETRS